MTTTKKTPRVKTTPCCFCGARVVEPFSNNAQPVMDGRCCSDCNATVVLPARLSLIFGTGTKK